MFKKLVSVATSALLLVTQLAGLEPASAAAPKFSLALSKGCSGFAASSVSTASSLNVQLKPLTAGQKCALAVTASAGAKDYVARLYRKTESASIQVYQLGFKNSKRVELPFASADTPRLPMQFVVIIQGVKATASAAGWKVSVTWPPIAAADGSAGNGVSAPVVSPGTNQKPTPANELAQISRMGFILGSLNVGTTIYAPGLDYSSVTPARVTNDWYRCSLQIPPLMSVSTISPACVLVANNAQTYVPGSQDVGTFLGVKISVSNAGGVRTLFQTADRTVSPKVVTAPAPFFNEVPALRGEPWVGEVLVQPTATFTGLIENFTSEWYKCSADARYLPWPSTPSQCQSLGSNQATLTLNPAHLGWFVGVLLKVLNANGGHSVFNGLASAVTLKPETPQSTPLPNPTATPAPGVISNPTPTPIATPSAPQSSTPTYTPAPAPAPVLTSTPVPSKPVTPIATPSPLPAPVATPSPSPTPTLAPTPTPTPTPTATPTATPTPSPSPSPTVTPKPPVKTVYVPNFIGLNSNGVRNLNALMGNQVSPVIAVARGYSYSVRCRTLGNDRVIKQFPAAGISVLPGSIVSLDSTC